MRVIHSLAFCSVVLCGIAMAQQKSPAKASSQNQSITEPQAVIHTSMGDIHCTLFPTQAPIGANNFIGLARGTKDWKDPVTGTRKHGVPLYNGVTFHRVIPEFMIQGGDPAGTGEGEPGYHFKNETSPDLTFDRPGRLAYANAGPDTNGSQFFITEVPVPRLNGNYTIFGQCGDEDVVKKIARVPRNSSDKPLSAVTIRQIEITGAGEISKPAAKAVTKTPPRKSSIPAKHE